MVASEGQSRISIKNASNEEALLEAQRKAARREVQNLSILGIVAVALVIGSMLLPTGIFSSGDSVTLSTITTDITNNLYGLISVFTGNGALFETRFMGVIVCAVSGAAIGMCGSAYQGAFNNPLAAPKTLGVMAGGAFGGLIYVLFLRNLGPQMPGTTNSFSYLQRQEWLATLTPPEWLWQKYGMSICSIIGCLLVVAIVVFLTSVLSKGKLSNIIVIIFGQVFAASVTAVIAFARYWFTQDGDIDTADALKTIENYTMNVNFYFEDLLIVVLPIVICIVIVLCMGKRLTLLSFGDDEAASMGINVNRSRYAMIIVCTIMTAFAISFFGHVAFLGFISAHVARRIVGPNFRFLLPASLFTGAGFLTLIEYICESGLPFTDANAAGAVCSILGSLVFIIMVLVQWRKGGSGEWR